MQHQDSTPPTGDQALALPIARVVEASRRLKRTAPQFGWPMLVLLLLAPASRADSIEERLWSFAAAVPFFAVALALRLWARGYLRKEGLVLDGPYRHVRNPVELGALFAFVGALVSLAVPVWYGLAILALAVLALSFNGVFTDKELTDTHGTMYLRYMRRVRRWIPTLLPGSNRSHRTHSLRAAWIHEKDSLIWMAMFLVVAAIRAQLGAPSQWLGN